MVALSHWAMQMRDLEQATETPTMQGLKVSGGWIGSESVFYETLKPGMKRGLANGTRHYFSRR